MIDRIPLNRDVASRAARRRHRQSIRRVDAVQRHVHPESSRDLGAASGIGVMADLRRPRGEQRICVLTIDARDPIAGVEASGAVVPADRDVLLIVEANERSKPQDALSVRRSCA